MRRRGRGWPTRMGSAGIRACFFLALAWPLAAAAQMEFSGLPAPGAPVFDLDFAPFRAAGDSVRLEIYYRITNPRLSYVRRPTPSEPAPESGSQTPSADEQYVAAYEMTAVLAGDDDPQAATVRRRENYALESFEETRNPSGYLVNILTVMLLPEEYELTMTLLDRVSGNTHRLTRDVDLRDFRESDWPFGGPEFFEPAAQAPDHPDFQKGEFSLVPNVKRSYSGTSDRLAMYLEVDLDRQPQAQALVVNVEQRKGRRRYRDTLEWDRRTGILPIVYRSSLPGLRTGEARMRLSLIDAEGETLGEDLETVFWIDWTMSGMIHEDWEEAVDMLVHIAGGKTLKALRETAPEEREQALEDFWKTKDPSPETAENEWKEEYYRRIRFVNLRFTTAFRSGWRTDYGTVYVRYGEPDEIERHPFERGQKPYQVWFYYAQRREFLFVDLRGNGEYELQYPYDGLIR